jgi:hypothetical protein
MGPQRTVTSIQPYRPRKAKNVPSEEVRFLAHGYARCATHKRPFALDQHEG